MDYKSVIFDLDGVICSTDEYHYTAWKKISDENNLNFDEEINNQLRGVSRMESLEIILKLNNAKFTDDEKNNLATMKNSYYVELLDNMSTKDLSNDVKKTLETLKENDIKIAIGSSSKNAKLILNKLGIIDLFDVIVDGNDIVESKPNPEVFLKASDKLGFKPTCCLVVEDAIAGVDAGIAGGFDVAGIGDAKNDTRVKYKLDALSDLLNE